MDRTSTASYRLFPSSISSGLQSPGLHSSHDDRDRDSVTAGSLGTTSSTSTRHFPLQTDRRNGAGSFPAKSLRKPGDRRQGEKSKPDLRIKVVKEDLSQHILATPSSSPLPVAANPLQEPALASTDSHLMQTHLPTKTASDSRKEQEPSSCARESPYSSLSERTNVPTMHVPASQPDDSSFRNHRALFQRSSNGAVDQPASMRTSRSRSRFRSRLLPKSFGRAEDDWKSLNPPTPQVDRFVTPPVPSSIPNRPRSTGLNEDMRRTLVYVDKPLVRKDTPSPVSPDTLPSALRSARARVAELKDSAVSMGFLSECQGQAPREDRKAAGIYVHDTPRKPVDSLMPDPLVSLQALTTEADSLHARYAVLKAERQRISGALVSRLKQDDRSPKLISTLLDDQLTLAAVSSSMDICIAKLKSLDCVKEEIIAGLTLRSPRIHNDLRSGIFADATRSVPRSPSTAPSLDSDISVQAMYTDSAAENHRPPTHTTGESWPRGDLSST